MKDLRIHTTEPKSGYAMLVSGILAMVVGGAMLLAGIFATVKVGVALDPLSGGEYVNTTHYCDAAGAWNTTDCVGGTLTALPTEYTPFTNISSNLFDALEVGGVVIIFIGIALLVQGVRSLGA